MLLGTGPLASMGLPGAVHTLAFAGEGLLASGGADGTLRVHETTSEDLAVEASASVANAVLCVKAAPGAPRLASAGGTGRKISDAGISLWRVEVSDDFGKDPAEKRPRLEDLLEE